MKELLENIDFNRVYDNLSNIFNAKIFPLTEAAGKGKYWARQLDPEFFNYEVYYSEQDAENDLAWFGGNRDYRDINEDLRKDIAKALEDIYYDIDNRDNGDPDAESDYEIVNYYFHMPNRNEVPKIYIPKIVALAEEYSTCRSQDENEVLAEALSLKYGKRFVTGTIRGNSQSDWMDYICPAGLNVDYIEAVFFATGTEFAITEDRYETEPDWSEANTFTAYTDEWSDTGLVTFVADELGCFPEDVVVMVLEDYRGEYRIL